MSDHVREEKGCDDCEHTTWRPYWILQTQERGYSGQTIRRRERIDSRIVVEDLRKKIGKNQIIYDFREPCSCRPAQLEVSE